MIGIWFGITPAFALEALILIVGIELAVIIRCGWKR
jgi:hypothetical protein